MQYNGLGFEFKLCLPKLFNHFRQVVAVVYSVIREAETVENICVFFTLLLLLAAFA